MRARFLTLLLAMVAIFAAASARAARVDIVLAQESPGSTNWDLRISAVPGTAISSLALLVSDNLTSYTPILGDFPPICALGFCGGPPGFNLLDLAFTPPLSPSYPVLLGIFGSSVNTAGLVQVLPADDLAGGTVFDAQGAPIPDFSIRVVPEPAAGALMLVGLSALGWVRCAANGI